MGLANALNHKPVRVLGFLTALHSIVYGIGYLSGMGGFDGALVGLAIQSFVVTASLGIVLLVAGTLLAFAYVRQNPKTIRYVSFGQSIIWLFIAFMYLYNGAYLLSICVGFVWATLSAYIAFAAKNRESIMAYDQTDKAKQDTAKENK